MEGLSVRTSQVPSAPDPQAVKNQLEALLASPEFVQADRLARFLRYVVERWLARPLDPPKEHELALEVFDRPESFDSRVDAIVRVQANRLRTKLTRYYQSRGSSDPVLIEMPIGGYALVIRARPAAEQERLLPPPGADLAPKPGRRNLILISASVTLLLLLAVSFVRRENPAPVADTMPDPKPLTAYPGWEAQPTFSPDGSRFAFVWYGEQEDNLDIYVQAVGSGTPVRLTSDSASDLAPAWSPDGEWIAFFRGVRGAARDLRIIHPNGTGEQRIGEVQNSFHVAWTPDNRWLVVSDVVSPGEPNSLVRLSIQTGEKRRLTTPAGKVAGDFHPAISPGGKMLAFYRDRLMVAPLSQTYDLAAEPRAVSEKGTTGVRAVEWTPDGRELVFCATISSPDFALWRVPEDGSSPPRRIAQSGAAGRSLAFARSSSTGRTLLAFAREALDFDIWRTDVNSHKEERLIASTRTDTNPQYSPDGNRIAFMSTRSGTSDIWLANADGTNPVPLTSMGKDTGTPRWSPDGRSILFDSNAEGQWEIYSILIAGGSPRRLTEHAASDAVPSWSRDGNSIYFCSDRTGIHQVWKVPAVGGEPKQVTQGGGCMALESIDGKLLYYMRGNQDCNQLWSVPSAGGQEAKLLDPVCWRGFVPTPDGIWYLRSQSAGRFTGIIFQSFHGQPKVLAPIKGDPGNGLSISPDGRYLLYARREQRSDLMLIDDFH